MREVPEPMGTHSDGCPIYDGSRFTIGSLMMELTLEMTALQLPCWIQFRNASMKLTDDNETRRLLARGLLLAMEIEDSRPPEEEEEE